MFTWHCLSRTLLLAAAMLSSGARADPVGDEFFVDTERNRVQNQHQVAALKDSGFVVTWSSSNGKGIKSEIEAQLFDADGAPVGQEFTVNTFAKGLQSESSVAGLGDGGFVATWTSNYLDGGRYGIIAQRFDAAGGKVGDYFVVNTDIRGDQHESKVVALSNGGFIVVWATPPNALAGQIYNAAGGRVGGQFPIGAASDVPGCIGIGAVPGGGFVLTRGLRVKDGATTRVDLYAQRYSNSGTSLGAAFKIDDRVNCTGRSNQTENKPVGVQLAALHGAGFVVVWQTFTPTNGGFLRAQRYGSSGAPVGDRLVVTTFKKMDSSNGLHDVSIAPMSEDGFVVNWVLPPREGATYDPGRIFGQRYSATAAPVGDIFHVAPLPPPTLERRTRPLAVRLEAGAFAVIWTGRGPPLCGQQNCNTDIRGQLFGPGAP